MRKVWDIAVVGGGLAGLAYATLCAEWGLSVVVFEKGEYPRQKVCGEYISKESYRFMEALGLPVGELQLPHISRFCLTNGLGGEASCNMAVGGIGISRYLLDRLMAEQAVAKGATLLTHHAVADISQEDGLFCVKTAQHGHFWAKLAVGGYGRVSGLAPVQRSSTPFVGVKYHVSQGPAPDTIEIHHFEGGYCGISQVEDGRYCLCYLAEASGLKAFKGDLQAYEQAILAKNPQLAVRLQAPRLTAAVTTSQLHFGLGQPTNYPLLGDAAGFIPPLTGNGMSLAFRSAHHLFEQTKIHVSKPSACIVLRTENERYRQIYLKKRINKGIFLQKLLLVRNPLFQRLLMHGLTSIPGLLPIMVKQAVGKGF